MNIPKEMTSYVRVLKLASTPSTDDFLQISLVAGGGIVLVGFLGFVIFVIMTTLLGGA